MISLLLCYAKETIIKLKYTLLFLAEASVRLYCKLFKHNLVLTGWDFSSKKKFLKLEYCKRCKAEFKTNEPGQGAIIKKFKELMESERRKVVLEKYKGRRKYLVQIWMRGIGDIPDFPLSEAERYYTEDEIETVKETFYGNFTFSNDFDYIRFFPLKE